MNWTVSRRIITGFAIALGLVALTAAIGIWALNRTANAYRTAVAQEQELLLAAVDARGSVRVANIEFLRFLIEEEEAYAARLDSAVTSARAQLGVLSAQDSADQVVWGEAMRLLDEWAARIRQGRDLASQGNMDAALSARADAAAVRVQLESLLDDALVRVQTRTEDTIDAAQQTSENSERAMILALAITIIVGVITAYLLNRAISRPLQETSTVLATSAAEILATTTEQASGATESMAAVTETAATVDEVVQTAEQAAERARAVASSAQHAADIGRQGRQAVEQSGEAMEQVRTQVNTIGNSILELAEQAQAIGEIITTVNDLAEQTNLLALNAAIEAARAGEQGRGFSVVAGEVRGLAEQSKNATVRVRQILGEIQRATSAAVMATEQGNKQVEEGSKQVREAGETIRQLADAVQGASQAAAQISASASQQSTGMTQIKQAVASIQQAAQQNLAATKQAEAAAQELNRVGTNLIELVGTEIRRPTVHG